ncbi:MAG TPA: hypothetical protein VGM87_06135 [Roseomonas sp.]|jgi:hypothetical protein
MPADDCGHHTEPAPGERGAYDLGSGELFVVAALRAWVAPIRDPDGTHPDWQALFRMAGVAGEAAHAFDRLMGIVARSAIRLLDVRCCRCPGVGADEEAMLRIIGALQAGEALSAIEDLIDWLPQDALTPALQGAQRFATLTAAAGLRLPFTMSPAQSAPACLPGGAADSDLRTLGSSGHRARGRVLH